MFLSYLEVVAARLGLDGVEQREGRDRLTVRRVRLRHGDLSREYFNNIIIVLFFFSIKGYYTAKMLSCSEYEHNS